MTVAHHPSKKGAEQLTANSSKQSRMTRKTIGVIGWFALVLASLGIAEAQQPGKVPRGMASFRLIRILWHFAFATTIACSVVFVPESLLAASANTKPTRSLVPYSTNYFPKGEPLSTITVLTVPPNLRAPFNIEVRNGNPSGQRRVSHSMIWLNETPIVETADFEKGVSTIKRNVTLNTENNIVRVDLAGPVGSYLWISITGTPDHEHVAILSQIVWLGLEEFNRRLTIFSVNPYIDPPFEITVVQPALGSEVVPVPVTITLNGKRILAPSDFQQNVQIIRREIDLLRENNKLEIESVKGSVVPPGFGVQIRGKRTPQFPGPLRPLH